MDPAHSEKMIVALRVLNAVATHDCAIIGHPGVSGHTLKLLVGSRSGLRWSGQRQRGTGRLQDVAAGADVYKF